MKNITHTTMNKLEFLFYFFVFLVRFYSLCYEPMHLKLVNALYERIIDENFWYFLSANLLRQFEDLYLNANYSDVTFIVEEEKVPAHELILIVRSSYFRSLITSDSTKLPKKVIELEVSLGAFKHALRFMYTGHISLPQIDYATVVDLLRLAYDYPIEDFLSAIQTYLIKNLSLENYCDVLHAACLFDSKIENATLTFIDQNASQILSTDKFTTLPRRSLCFLLKRDSFYAPEVEIFKAILEWRKCNQNVDVKGMEVHFIQIIGLQIS